MPVDSIASLVDALRRARLLEPAQLDEAARLQSTFRDPRALAGELIRRDWLTPFQANQLLQGRGHELLLGSYVLLERVGEGGFGAVFKARNWKLGKVVALKLIRKERIDNPDAVRRFHREIRAAAQLDHPNIVRAIDADEVNGTHLLVMEYVQGTDLAKLIKKGGALSADKACDYCGQAALGLQHASERGLVHRDIKPHNLLLTPSGVAKILDMGLARLDQGREEGEASSTVTREGTVMGTLDFIAPEQAMDSHTVDVRADLYSLGCTLYYLLTGRVPFPGGTAMEKLVKHQSKEPEPVERVQPGVPSAVAAVVRKLMAKRPEERYSTAAEAAAALDAAGRATASPTARPALSATDATAAGWSSLDTPPGTANTVAAPPRRASRGISPWIMLGTAINVGLLVLGLLVFFLILPGPPSPPPVVAKPPAKTPDTEPQPRRDPAEAAFEKWCKEVAALPAEKQGGEVAAELKRHNPGFDGVVQATVKDGVVAGLEFMADKVTDIRPVRALAELSVLRCSASAAGQDSIADLTPLMGMPLTELWCDATRASDLAPLRGMPLAILHCDDTPVSDLSPLKGMALKELWCNGTRVSDLSSLRGMPLEVLGFNRSQVTDLAPLQGMPLTLLGCDRTRVSDLSPLKGMPLSQFFCYGTPISDLSPLKGMPLSALYCEDARITDFSVLQNMPLQILRCDFDPKRDAAILRSIPTLEKINGQSAAELLPNAASDGSGLIGSWGAKYDGYTQEIQVTRSDAGVWDVKCSFLLEGKEVGNWVGVQPRFSDGILTYSMHWLVKPKQDFWDAAVEMWTFNDRAELAFCRADNPHGFQAQIVWLLTQAAK